MAKFKVPITNYYQADTFLGNRTSRKLTFETRVRRIGVDLHIQLCSNTIAVFEADNKDYVRIYDGGWQTNMTKDRLNQILQVGYCIYQNKNKWYLETPFATASDKGVIPFINGQDVPVDDAEFYPMHLSLHPAPLPELKITKDEPIVMDIETIKFEPLPWPKLEPYPFPKMKYDPITWKDIDEAVKKIEVMPKPDLMAVPNWSLDPLQHMTPEPSLKEMAFKFNAEYNKAITFGKTYGTNASTIGQKLKEPTEEKEWEPKKGGFLDNILNGKEAQNE